MELQPVLNKLKSEFGLKHKDIIILKALYQESLAAESISGKTAIPLGRIYSYLNRLADLGLIIRTDKRPFLYNTDKNNIIDFMKKKMAGLIKAETEMLDLMKGAGTDYIEMIDNREKFTFTHLRLLSESRQFNTVSIHRSFPFIMYPADFDSFIKLRKMIASNRPTISFVDVEHCLLLYKTYKAAYESEKPFNIIFEKSTLDEHVRMIKENLGGEFLQGMIRELSNKMKKGKLGVYMLNEYIPMQIDISEKKVALSIIHSGVITGILINSPAVVSLYQTFFRQMLSRAKPVMPYLKRLACRLPD